MARVGGGTFGGHGGPTKLAIPAFARLTDGSIEIRTKVHAYRYQQLVLVNSRHRSAENPSRPVCGRVLCLHSFSKLRRILPDELFHGSDMKSLKEKGAFGYREIHRQASSLHFIPCGPALRTRLILVCSISISCDH